MQVSAVPEGDVSVESWAEHENSWYSFRDFDGYRISEQPLHTRRKLKVICIGAGAAGLIIAYKASKLLKDVELKIYDKNADVGGTWLENRYPGCACDIPSHAYQFSWNKNPNWSHFYSGAEEIWEYMKDTAVKFDLERYITFNTKALSATWDEDAGLWHLKLRSLSDGQIIEDSCNILINGTGVLNEFKMPKIPHIENFRGKLMHSARFDPEYDLTSKRVAVIGGGSSGVQLIPTIQPKVKRLYAFLRSPVWITMGFGGKHTGPGGTNFEYSEEQQRDFQDKQMHEQYCRDVEGELNRRFSLMQLKSKDQAGARQFLAGMMKEQLGHDEQLTEHLTPSFAVGCRRMTPGSGYLQSLKAENMTVVPNAAVRFTENGIVGEDGVEREVDVVICATGFDTTFTPKFEVHGRNGAEIHRQFGDFPVGYLGIAAENFPNLFLFVGPNGPVSHASYLPALEWYTRYLFQVIEKMQTENIKAVAPKPAATKDFYNHTHELMKRLAWSSACRSWFKNGKTHGPVTAVYPGSRLHFFEALKNVRWEDYEIDYVTSNRFQFFGNGFSQTELDPEADSVWYMNDDFVNA
jgi:cation diffusion facilitator CzcD-associated flavoprotein CzcO